MSTIAITEQVAPATPNANQIVLYAKSDGLLYWKDDTGAEHGITELAATRPDSGSNLFINGNWLIDQLNEGALYTVSSNNQGPDGWSGALAGSGIFKLRTVVDPEAASQRCLEITCTTIDASIAAGDRYFVYSCVEGYDISDLGSGSAAAGSVNLRFKFKTSVTGTYGIFLKNGANTRTYLSSIVVANTNENEYSMVIPLDTTGAWLFTSGTGFMFGICLAAGSTYHGAAGWQAGDPSTIAAQVNFMSNVANIAYLKRIQLLPGPIVLPYAAVDYEKDLLKCHRYLYVWTSLGGTGIILCIAHAYGSGSSTGVVYFPVPMRINPVMSVDGAAFTTLRAGASGADAATVTFGTGSKLCASLTFASANLTVGQATRVDCGSSSRLIANARLS